MLCLYCCSSYIFFFHVTTTPAISTLSLHDALPISNRIATAPPVFAPTIWADSTPALSITCVTNLARLGSEYSKPRGMFERSEEHTSELQSPYDLVCRLLLEKKKK